jgi:DNA-binding transcriptional LysR family regulator
VEFRHLRALVAIADTRSFSEAALRLGYVQSTVSYHLLALEEAVGAKLVQRRRGAREVSLTPAGETLALSARRVLSELGAAEQELSRGGDGRAVAVAVATDLTRFLLPRLHRMAAHGGFGMRTFEVIGSDVDALLASGACTLAAIEPAESAGLVVRPVLRDRIVFVEPLTRRPRPEPVGRAELEATSLVMHRGREARLLRSLDLRRATVTPGLSADTDAATIELVAAGLGAALVPELALNGARHGVHVRELAPDLRLPPRVVALAWARGRLVEPDEQALIDRLHDGLAAGNDELRPVAV